MAESNILIFDLTEQMREKVFHFLVHNKISRDKFFSQVPKEWSYNIKSETSLKKLLDVSYFFNTGIVQYEATNYYIIATRVIIPYFDAANKMANADLPIMWGKTIIHDDRKIKHSWNGNLDYSQLFIVEKNRNGFNIIYTADPTLIVRRINQHASEDPRLYIKADGNYYINYTSMDTNCPYKIRKDKAKCVYLTEYKLNISEGSISVENSIPLCANIIFDEIATPLMGDKAFMKNLSPWVSADGSDMLTDFLPTYTIYKQKEDQCTAEQSKYIPRNKDIYNSLIERYSFAVSRNNYAGKIKLFNMAGTTPAITVTKQLQKNLRLKPHANLKIAVGHVRLNFAGRIIEEKEWMALRKVLDISPFFDSLKLFLDKLVSYEDYLYFHNDIYCMILYIFDGTNGNIIYSSDVFLPMAWQKEGIPQSKIPLAFPCGIALGGDDIIISYGEGDIKSRLITIDSDTIRHIIHPYNDDYIRKMKYKILYGNAYNFKDQRKITTVTDEFLAHY